METRLTLYPAPEGVLLSEDYTVTVNGQVVDLYETLTRYGTSAFGYFDFSGTVEVTVTADFTTAHANTFQILPEKYGISFEKTEYNKITFTLDRPRKLTFVVNGDYTGRVLHLFANGLEENPPSPDDPNVLYFEPGFHDIGEDKKWQITLQDNQTLYLAGGAVVRGFIGAENAKNIKICGRGILTQDRHMPPAQGILAKDCEGIEVNGIILNRQGHQWSGSLHRSRDILIKDYKVVSPVIWSTDGMNLMNSSDAVYDDCFFRAGDDNIAIKGIGADKKHHDTGSPPALGLPNRNILIENCVFWSDNGTAVVLGQETKAAIYENITIRNCEVLFCRDDQKGKAALAIVCLHATDYKDILFENIHVGPCGQLIIAWNTEEIYGIGGNQSYPGEIDGVIFRNISTAGAGSKTIQIHGWNENKKVHHVTLENVVIRGEKLTQDSPYLDVNEYVADIKIR